jgi:CDP-diacylglycerol pyrophosphatase
MGLKALTLVIGVAALMLFLQTSESAETSHGASRGRSAPACQLQPKPNTLLSLAECCATDLKSDPDCRDYNQADSFVIVKDNDPQKSRSYLIISSVPVTGIEDAKIFKKPFVNFWQYGWAEAQKYLKKPADDTALAINSKRGRSQNQLHIHISCVLGSVAQTLASTDKSIGSDPAKPLTVELGPHGNAYDVIKVKSLSDANSPFQLVYQFPGAKAHMADQSIAVIGSHAAGVYYVLDTYAHGSNRGAAEELLNQKCG